MNKAGQWSAEEGTEVPHRPEAVRVQRTGRVVGDWLDRVIAEGRAAPDPNGDVPDNGTAMQAIADQMAELWKNDAPSPPRPLAAPALAPRFDPRAAIRDAVAEIARRQADLDRHGGGESAHPQPADRPAGERLRAPFDGGRSDEAPVDARPVSNAIAPGTAMGRRRASSTSPGGSSDLSSEVEETFARFSRDLQDAIHATDTRPAVEALDREIREIGRAVYDIGAGLPDAQAVARIGEQTREMRDLLKAGAGRGIVLEGVERQVAALEARLERMATVPTPARFDTAEVQEGGKAPGARARDAAPADFAATMADVRSLLQGFHPGAAMATLETRFDDLTNRIARGLDAQGPAGLIEGLSRRVDEVHASLRSQLAESAVDTRPLEGLVRGLTDRLGQARDASADVRQLEAAMHAVAAKVDVAASGVGSRTMQGLEAQLAGLAQRLDRSEASLKALDGVEHALGELFSQFEVTRQVAIDAAETAARTAARDTLRAALQEPGLARRSPEMPSALADQMVQGLDELRNQQDMAERRASATLSDMQAMMERLVHHIEISAAEEPRRRRPAPEPVPPEPARLAPEPALVLPEAARVEIDPADLLIEPGFGRGGVTAPRDQPRFAATEPLAVEPRAEEARPAASTLDGDGSASFIAAARRAAQAAQASAVSRATARPAAPGRAAPRQRPAKDGVAEAVGMLGRAKAFLDRRRRPILLGLAALVLLVGALEVVNLGVAPAGANRVSAADSAPASHDRVADLPPRQFATTATQPVAVVAQAPTAATPPAAARAALPLFVAGPAKPANQAPAPTEGIGDGLRSLALAGGAAAQYELGLRFADGRGVARDPRQAMAWFEKAAAQGSAPAQYRLGSAYEKGVGTERDPAQAMTWYGKAAEAGNIRAMHNLAVMSAEGAVGKPDYARAAQWFGRASSFGVRDSQFNLAILYARGLGIEQSLAQSYTWFAIAAAGGDGDAGKKRDEVGAKLDPKVLASAKAAADAFRAVSPIAAANEVTPPLGGWDTAPRPPAGSGASAPGAKVSQL